MGWLLSVARRWKLRRSNLLEVAGLSLLTVGVHQVSEPAAFIFAGAALVLIAQGLERRE